ncbi:MAG TPA: hypothetical protein EYO40_00900 [Phycisphaerales bacterium]|nr:hypothetical protein [Phycisphaerales bacterium]HIB49844.1 hypothetical protein [Phycisphaerales bacterium]HIN84307.1 hypothetical protein [Phycisphaerales bacterium]HIO19778.1 hypothetical protein [Phycisphaerales bacterium]
MINIHELACEFFGLPVDSDGFQLLGLVNSENIDANTIKRAMRRRYAQLLASPKSSSEDAELVKKYLGTITVELLHAAPTQTPLVEDSRQKLTPLDHSIIAALIAGGGWNSNTRSRLVSIAGSYSLTVGGLMRILEALAEAARNGKGPLAIERRNEIALDRTWATVPIKKSTFSIAEEYIFEVTKNFTPDFKAQNPLLTIKLAIVFGSLTLLAFILTLSVLFSEDVKKEIHVPFVPDSTSTLMNNEPVLNPVLFDVYPSFSVRSIGDELLQRSDEILTLPEHFAELHKYVAAISSSSDNERRTFFLKWEAAIDLLANGWVFADKDLVRSLELQIVLLIEAIEKNSQIFSRMLSAFAMKPITTQNPLSITANIWSTGILTRLACDKQLTIASKEQIKQSLIETSESCNQTVLKQKALAFYALELASRTEFNSTYLTLWEDWIQTVKSALLYENASVTFLNAISCLLNEGIDVSRESNSRLVIGRIVKEIEWAKSEVARDRVIEMYTAKTYSPEELQLLGLLLQRSKKASWLSSMCIIQPNDSMQTRSAKATLLLSNWPSESSTTTMVWNLSIPDGFTENLYAAWSRAYESVLHLPIDNPLVSARVRKVNEAAVYIWKGRPDLAFQKVDPTLFFEEIPQNTLTRLQRKSPDGEWSKLFRNAGSNSDRRIEIIETLAGAEHESLGEQDARTLATAALSNVYSRIRLAATHSIVTNFLHCPNVAIAIVDNFSDAKSNKQIVKLVANLTEAILPEQEEPDWLLHARRALVQHALTVENSNAEILDLAAVQLARSYIAEYLLLQPTALPPSREITPLESITLVVDEWVRYSSPFENTISNYEFNSLGIMQSFLRHQITYLQLLIIAEAKWRGQDKLYYSAQTSLTELGNATSIIEQMTMVELAIASHWNALFESIDTEYKNRLNNQ